MARRLDALRTLPLELTPLCEALSLVCYGKIVPEPEEIDMAAKAYGALFAALPWWQKVQLILQRAFWPLKKRDFYAPLSANEKAALSRPQGLGRGSLQSVKINFRRLAFLCIRGLCMRKG